MDPLPYQKIRGVRDMRIKVLRDQDSGLKKGSVLEAREFTNVWGGFSYQVIEDGPFLGETLKPVDAMPIKDLPNTITSLVHEAHENAISKGWYDEPRTFGDMIALIHSELSEALEDYRIGHNPNKVWYEGKKPCGIPIELADACIRIFDMCGYFGIDLEKAIREKMAYNATRPQRHGGKKL